MAVIPLVVYKNDATTFVISGGATAPPAGTTETWTVSSSAPFPDADTASTPPTMFFIGEPDQPGELIEVTGMSGTAWQVTRGAEGTVPVSHSAPFTVVEVVSAGTIAAMMPGGPDDWLNVVLDYGADPAGAVDSTPAFTAAIAEAAATGGTVWVPPGTYAISSGPLIISSGGWRLAGAPGAVLKTTANGLFSLTGSVQQLELDHLTMDVTGGDVFNASHYSRCHFHHLTITQRSAGSAVWNSPALVLALENRWEYISYTLTSTARTVPAWHFVMGGSNDLFNENEFRHIVANNNGPDAAQPQWLVDVNTAGNMYQANTWSDITFENPLGGGIKVLSGQQTTFERIRSWDLSADPSGSLISVGTDPTSGVGPAGTSIRDCGRSFGPVSGANGVDIRLDAGALDTLIENYYQQLSGPEQVYIDLGGSQGTVIIGPPANLVLQGTSDASWTQVGGPAPVTYTDAAGHTYTLQQGAAGPEATDQNLIAWSCDPEPLGNGSSPAAGQLQLIRVIVRQAKTITNILAHVTVAGSGLTAAENFAALFDSAGHELGVTADQSAAWASTGLKTMPLAGGPVAVAAGIAYYVVLLANGTTTPQFLRGGGVAGMANVINAGLTSALPRYATNGSALTAVPSSITMSANTLSAVGYWAAVS
ncbi:MAG TPA: glycosyl hydrolase family 28-related protein [Streptosporangiaceae bacterium]|nr:glycosyl hydrolase family 28-related protein [Streptosporangiaceae bacterium]